MKHIPIFRNYPRGGADLLLRWGSRRRQRLRVRQHDTRLLGLGIEYLEARDDITVKRLQDPRTGRCASKVAEEQHCADWHASIILR